MLTTSGLPRARPLILIVSDDENLLRSAAHILEQASYAVESVAGVSNGVSAVLRLAPNLVLLDVAWGARSARDVCMAIRECSAVPMILLSRSFIEDEAVEALTTCADDYMVRPVAPRLLIARIRAVLKRASHARATPANTARIFGLTVDFDQRTVAREGQPIRVTPTEFRILEVLLANRGRVMSNRDLAAEVWGPRDELDDHRLRVNLSRLRKKIELRRGAPQVIVTRPWSGYLIPREG